MLKKDYDGAETSIRYGYPAGGEGQQITFSNLVGKSWDSGNIMGIFEYNKQSNILQTQRDYIPTFTYPGDISPDVETKSFLVTGHQNIFDEKTVVDGSLLYSNRNSTSTVGGDTFSDLTASDAKQYGATIGISHDFSGGWVAGVNGNASRSKQTYNEALTYPPYGVFNNQLSADSSLQEASIKADGPLFQLGTRSVKLAVGAGYRAEQLKSDANGVGSDFRRHIEYVYGELFIPLIILSLVDQNR